MTQPGLAERLRAGETLISGWTAIADPLVAEMLAREAFDCIVADMQHGQHDARSIAASITGVALAGKPLIVRIPVGDYAFASRALDMGAAAVIAPMINSAAEARAFIAATKYPPLGERSWGPTRALALSGKSPQAQLETSNTDTLAFAMIETDRAIGALEDILSVPGLDGVFVGPSDLSVTLSGGKRIAPFDASLDVPLRHIADIANAGGKIAGAFSADANRVRRYRELGYRLLALGSDYIYLGSGARMMLDTARRES